MFPRIPQPGVPPPGVSFDARGEQRREQMVKDMVSQEVVRSRAEGETVVDALVRRLGPGGEGLKVASIGPEDPRRAAQLQERRADQQRRDGGSGGDRNVPLTEREAARALGDIPRALASFQKEQGLPLTGRVDLDTLRILRDANIVPPPPLGGGQAQTAGGAKEAPAPAPPVSKAEQEAQRRLNVSVEKQEKKKVDGAAHDPTTLRARVDVKADRVADPARLLASLFTAGFVGQKGGLEEALKTFQAAFGLPMHGELDATTTEALAAHGFLGDAGGAAGAHGGAAASDAKKGAGAETDKRAPARAQPAADKRATASETAARGPQSNTAPKEQSRTDNRTAAHDATSRGVPEHQGDLAAQAGQGKPKGEHAGLSGAGSSTGGVKGEHGDGARVEGEAPGDEAVTANADSGDEDAADMRRGRASIGDAPDVLKEGEHYEVPALSEQARAALKTIRRDDDGKGPVTYSWEVSFFRPGVYGAGQAAEEIWRVAVQKATAFDAVWAQAAAAIAQRFARFEPEAEPLTADDFTAALKRARVADTGASAPALAKPAQPHAHRHAAPRQGPAKLGGKLE